MSINPVAGIDPTESTQNPDIETQPLRPWPGVTPKPASSATESGSLQEREIQPPKASAEPQQLPEDEVQVQHDRADGEIVIRYLDKSGDVILQVPSSQMVGMTRSIASDFQEEAKLRRNELEGRSEERNHGY
ncbi:MAG TPA: hypothetical protein VHW45_03980 [Candidatus Sulfotelmatobacter sp.]|nr:hypothetical protein [Candidatus Sulfotelmatobacter sp.]